MVRYGVRVQEPVRFLDSIGERLVNDDLTAQEVASVLNLSLLLSTLEEESKRTMPGMRQNANTNTSIAPRGRWPMRG